MIAHLFDVIILLPTEKKWWYWSIKLEKLKRLRTFLQDAVLTCKQLEWKNE